MSEHCNADISSDEAKSMLLCLGAITPDNDDYAGKKRYFIRHKGRIYAVGDTPEEALSYASAYLNNVIRSIS